MDDEPFDIEPLPMPVRERVLSANRLKLTLMLFVLTVLLALSAMIFLGVTHIFEWLTPTIRQDLENKARRSAVELAQSAQFGMVLADTRLTSAAVSEYSNDHDVSGLSVLDSAGKLLFQQGSHASQLKKVLGLQHARTHDLGEFYAAWMPSEIEGVVVGRVAVLISKARLEAGAELRQQILFEAAAGCLVALLACLVFVNMYIGPILRVTGEAFARLERTTEAALAATRLKSQFLANMSHEIRTPMNGVIGMLDLLNRTPLNPKQLRYTQTIETSARGLLTIINDVLDFSKLEAGKYELRLDAFDVSQLVQEAAELLSPKAHAKQLELIVRVDADVPDAVHGDVDRLKQVLLNLLGNAIKFTEHGHIELRVSRAGSAPPDLMLRFSVTDTGLGIRPEDQRRLFGVFSQVDGSLTRKYGGTGLGLAISRRLAEAMGGTAGVQSALGQGSTFWFTIRTTAATLHDARVVTPREASVLLVCGIEAQRAAIRELLVRWGMQCEFANTADAAAKLVVSHVTGFNAAIVDDNLEMDPQNSTRLFDLCMTEGVPVIRLLATNQITDERAAPRAQTVLYKPVRASELYDGLVTLLDGGVGGVTTQHGQVRSEPVAKLGVAPRGRVLVVDDNAINQLVAVELLTELGYETDTACNGLEAVAKAEAGGWGAILMDCQMPELDGFQATQRIRALHGAAARVPIIALTAHAMVDYRDRVLRAGMDDYTTKPIRGQVLDDLLRRWIVANGPNLQPAIETIARESSGAEKRVAATLPAALPARPSTPVRAAAQALDPSIPRSPRAIELFLKTVPELIEALTQAVSAEDPVRVKQLAHKLKGNCLSLGATRMASACHAVELAALAGNIDVAAHRHIPAQLVIVAPLLAQLLEPKASNDR